MSLLRTDLSVPAIESLAAACLAADGTDPLDEYAHMLLRNHPDRVRVARSDHGFALAYGGQVAVAVAPEHRGQGIGSTLLAHLLAQRETAGDSGPLEAWSHGLHPAAARLAANFGFTPVRELWVMRRSIGGPDAVPLPPVPAHEWTLRSWTPADRDDLLAVNAAAFAEHPEQGAMDAANLADRMAESWFSPADLLIADDSAHGGPPVLGFHWTKQHSATEGEVYVVGVAPQAQGRGLGKALTLAGLHHLASLGITEVHLYVESDNAPAVAVYAKLGFTHTEADTHIMYARSERA